jgi:ATP-dependent metalloprotease FtsH
VGILLVAYVTVIVSSQPHVSGERLTFTTFLQLAQEGRVRDAKILDVDSFVVGSYVRTTGEVRAYNTPYLKEAREPLLQALVGSGTPTTIEQQNAKRTVQLVSLLLPGLIIAVLFLYLILSYRQGTGLFGRRSRVDRHRDQPGVTFADVAGQDAAVAELREITTYLAAPDRFRALGASVPKGILLYGPPGCGKTLLARAVAGEAEASFFSLTGSDFVEMFAGVGAARVRDLFSEARRAAPAIVFVDELDSVGRARRVQGVGMSNDEQEQALNQLLAEMDGFSASDGVIVLGATNRPDLLDPALLRPGRFDRSIGLERPNEIARQAILRLHLTGKPLGPGVDVPRLAQRAVGLTGADLATVVNEGALLAARAGRSTITQEDFDEALDRILDAPERQRRLALRPRAIGRRPTSGHRVTFDDVAGVDDAVEELREVRTYLTEPDRFASVGARPPRGILLAGPPGCGKTLLAQAVAGEANAAFFSVAASEFVNRYVGVGAAAVRDLFAEARLSAPAIVFIDEIDGLGARRAHTGLDADPERDQTLNQLLVELDGFDPSTGVTVMAATNRPDLLDPALIRPGRFDRRVTVSLPDRAGRQAILALHARLRPLAPDVDLAALAAITQGFSGADLAGALNEAALLAVRRGQSEIGAALLEEAVDRARLGVASRGTVLADDERRLIAYHEAGHALVALTLRGADQLHKLSIVPRGGSLGRCTLADVHEPVVHSRSRLLDQLAIYLGGRAAEQLVFGEASSGAADDLARVGELARHMVRDLGMADGVGPLSYAGDAGGPSEEARRLIDAEARALAEEAFGRTLTNLAGSRPALDRLAEALLVHETLSVGEIVRLVGATPLAAGHRDRGGKPEITKADGGMTEGIH